MSASCCPICGTELPQNGQPVIFFFAILLFFDLGTVLLALFLEPAYVHVTSTTIVNGFDAISNVT